MFLVIYDIAENKLRTKFSKFLERFGERLQYSVFEIKNSSRILENIRVEIRANFAKKFDQCDSVMIIQMSDDAIIDKFGYAQNDDQELLIM